MEKKKDIDMVAIQPKKANAQALTCFIAWIATAVFAALMIITACVLPVVFEATAVMCWVCMALEAVSAGLGFVAYWVKCNAL
jgi:hypothetical protein